MEVASPGVSNGLPPSNPLPAADPSVVVHHLTEVLQGTLGAIRRDLESAGSLLCEGKLQDTLQRCGRFAAESQTALYAHKDIAGTEETNGLDEESGT